jgi:hypothetical protein
MAKRDWQRRQNAVLAADFTTLVRMQLAPKNYFTNCRYDHLTRKGTVFRNWQGCQMPADTFSRGIWV